MSFENSPIEQARTEHEILLEDPKTARKRKKADQRRRRKYKFSDKHHARLGIVSALLAIPAIGLVAASIVLSVIRKGEAGSIVGLMPFAAIILATAGIILSSVTFRKPDTIYTFSWIGLITNLVIWLFVAFVLVIGM